MSGLSKRPHTPLQYALNLVGEEGVEISHLIMKIQRFGLLDHHPSRMQSNLESLQNELSDLVASVDVLNAELIKNGIPPLSLSKTDQREAKIDKVIRYSQYSMDRGTLSEPLAITAKRG